ncbi:MAG: imidazolonepropionase [Xanthomonadales bacterium]|nr:imidazolonepropionase [Gammaproteobacteria bacterium]NNL04471.1 imidazolonepropionase [Xanthomonadales bacterium]
MRLLRNIGELATCPPENPQHDAGLIRKAALVIEEGIVAWSGPESDLPTEFEKTDATDCQGNLVIPGLIDCHTHLCFGGWRGDEFEMRLAGASYQEIAAVGGGIASTVKATREASADQLTRKAARILQHMLALGVTTVECKSGYGLDEENELKQLEIYRVLDAQQPVELVSTFLGAHIVPPEYTEDREAYLDLLIDVLIPRINRDGLAEYCDAFVEAGAFTAEEARRLFEAAKRQGLKIKLHADQLSSGGGASLAAEVGAVSAEHLEYIDEDGISALVGSGTVAVSLPLASLYLGERYLPARRLIDAGVPVAVATDFNPGSAPSFHLPLAMMLACLNQQMTPQEALMGATSRAARAIDREQRIGSLHAGYQADIVIIDAPSLNHWLYHFTPNACRRVFKNGAEVVLT